MPADDRERSFENALASHLRPGTSRGACSDAETLAAYHERSLAPEQMASLKTHVSDCARCQEILAHLQATDEIPIAVTNIAQPRTDAANSGVRVLPARRPTLGRWVAPAGALAAALLVWVAVHENNSLRVAVQGPKVDSNQTQIAKAQRVSPPPLPPPSLDATRNGDAASSDAFSSEYAAPLSQFVPAPKPSLPSHSKAKNFQSARKKSSAEGIFGQSGAASPKRVAPPVPEPGLQPQAPGSVSQTVTVEAAAPEVAENQAAAAAPARAAPEAKSANDKRDAAASRSAPSVPAMAGAAPASPSPALQSSQSVEVTTESSAIANLPARQREVTSLANLNHTSQVLLASSIAAVTVSAPGGRVSWRIGQAGIIEFSPDAGKTWIVQPSGIITDLLAGSAPSAKVCWIVGRNGTILRTTDRGKHWRKVKPPTQDDLRSVFAVNARQATVSPANGTYQTTDGGATWSKLPPE